MDLHEYDRRTFLSAGAILGADLAMVSSGSAVEQGSTRPKKTILVVGAHYDDAYGAAGLMLKAIKAGHRVVIVQACGDYSNWPAAQGRDKEFRAGVEQVARQMGAEIFFLPYKIHEVPVDSAIKHQIAKISDEVKPDIAVLMSENDYWTDHSNIGRAAKDGIMFAHGYLAKPVKRPSLLLRFAAGASQTYQFRPDMFVDISDVIDGVAQLFNRLDAALSGTPPKYISELGLFGAGGKLQTKMPMDGHADIRVAQCRVWGSMSGAHFAEAFETIQYSTRDLW